MTWYNKSKVFLEGVQLLNRFPTDDLIKVIDEIDESGGIEQMEFNREKHETPVNFTKDEGILLHKTILYFINRLHLFLITPTTLQKDFKDLGLNDEKVDCLLKYYCVITKTIVKDIKPSIESSPEQDQISYELKTAYANDVMGRTKHPVAKFVMKLNNQSIDMEMRREDVSKMFEGLELIQMELDNLASKK
ncbi:unnamed protein product [Diamesa hyperborea]